jgi:methionyl aminopeptidase
VGRELHEEPQVPCFVPLDSLDTARDKSAWGKPGSGHESTKIEKGMVLAIEVMYAMGSDKVEVLEDGWTIAMRDGKISGLFEDTVAVTAEGPKVLTR